MADRPNILWLTYEDTSPQFVSCYGETPVVTTPRIDALAADGVRCDRVFATAPVCSAARSALITGTSNEATGLGHHRSKYPIPRELLRGFPAYLQEAGYYTTNNAKTDYNVEDEAGFIAATWNESSGEAHWRKRGEGQPFFSVFNYADSHQSRTMTKAWGWYEEQVLGQLPPEQIVAPEEIAVPPIYRDSPEMRKHLSRVYNSLRLCDLRIGERLDELRADGLLEETIVFCFADHGEGIPRGKSNGIGFGYRAACVIWFPEKWKHLSPWGTQVVTDELISFEDLGPTVLALAGAELPDHMTGRPLMGEQRREPPACIFAARNRIDDTPDLNRSTIDGRFVYTRNYFPHLPVVKFQKYADVGDILRAIRRDYAQGELNATQAELVQPTRPREYLYDLDADGWEVRNLVDDPAYHDELQRLRRATREHALEIGDVMVLPERLMVERAESSPYEQRFDTTYNPLAAMLDAADLIGDADAVDQQLALLGDARDVVRYWAAVGLHAAHASLSESAIAAIRPHLGDSLPEVQIELAAALVGACADAEASAVLRRWITSGEHLLVHQAIEALIYMPATALPFTDAVLEAAGHFDESDVSGTAYPPRQATEMFRYLFAHLPLLYPDDEAHVKPEERVKDW